MDRISRSVERRRSGEPVRLVYDRDMAPDTLDYLKRYYISILMIPFRQVANTTISEISLNSRIWAEPI